MFSADSYPPTVVCAPGNPVLLAPSPFIPVENKDCDYPQTYPRKPPKWFYSPPVSILSSYILTSFDLKRVSTTATHKSGNRLDLIYTRYCSTDNTLVTPLHTSDHFLITSNLTLTPEKAHAPSQVTFRRNLRSLSPSRLSSMVSSALPSPSQFSALDTNSATDTLCFTLTSCLDNFCPLSSRPARATPSAPWLSDVLREHRAKLRAAERKWHKSKNSTDLSVYQSHLSSFSANVSTAKVTYYHNKINNCSDSRALFKTFSSSLLCPPPPPPSSTLTADDFATFFTNKTKTISDQFLTPQTNNNFITTIHKLSPPFLLSRRRRFPNSSFPIIPLLVR